MSSVKRRSEIGRILASTHAMRDAAAKPARWPLAETLPCGSRSTRCCRFAIARMIGFIFLALPMWQARAASVVLEVPIKSNDVAYSASTSKIYATVPSLAGMPYGNRLVEIDPFRGTIERSVFAGSEPGVIAVSDDGSFAYVGLDGAAAVRRVELTSMTTGLKFNLGRPELSETYFVDDMGVLPGLPDSVVVSRKDVNIIPSKAGVAVYDSGVKRPLSTPPFDGPNSIALLDSSTVVGYDNTSSEHGLWRLTIQADGITVQTHASYALNGYGHRIVTNSGEIFSTSGQAADGTTLQVLGSYGMTGPIVPEVLPGMTALVGSDGARVELFDRVLFNPTRTITLPAAHGTPRRASPCGPACLVFNTVMDRIIIVQIDYDSVFENGFD